VAACLLDLTRLVSRLGRGPLTGVDRVEAAYLDRLLAGDDPAFGLVRSKLGYLLLDRVGMQGLHQVLHSGALQPADLLSRLSHRRDPLRAKAEAATRRLAVARGPHLRRLLRHLPAGAVYLNVGHANLLGLAAMKAAELRVVVLVHDVIPLDYPQFTKAGIAPVFRRKLGAVAAHADLVVYSTRDAQQRAEAHLARMGRVPRGVVASLGVPVPQPDRAALPPQIDLRPPYMVTLGTVEPRKNHALLLDVWDLQPAVRLLILGGRGWAEPDLFTRIAATPGVEWHAGLSDGAVAAVLEGAAALLAPSLAEGFGLPVVEAAALGVPIIATDLAVTRDLLGDYPVYLDATDRYSWLETIVAQGMGADDGRRRRITPPSWEDHFNAVLSLV